MRPRLAGNVVISDGKIRPAPALFARRKGNTSGSATATSTESCRSTRCWKNSGISNNPGPVGPEVEADTSRSLKAAIPQVPALGFDNLRVTFGPKLAVTVAPIARSPQGR